MDYENMELELTLKEYYGIMVNMCERLENNPDDEVAVNAFVDAAYHLAKAKCHNLFPDDLLGDDVMLLNAAKTPQERMTITAVLEDDEHVVS